MRMLPHCQLPCTAEADGEICSENLKAEVTESLDSFQKGQGKPREATEAGDPIKSTGMSR